MKTNADSISLSQLRTGREKVYFVITILVSLVAWGFLGYYSYQQIAEIVKPVDLPSSCYVRDYSKVYRVDLKQLFEGEECLSWDQLTKEEQQNLSKESQDKVGKIITIFSTTTPISVVFFFLFSLFSHLISVAYIRLNGIKVGPNQFPEFFTAFQRLTQKTGMEKHPDMFIINGNGLLNAFATRLVSRKLIVIYSDLAEALLEEKDQRQVEAVMAHELGHQALGHTRLLEWFLFPGKLVPFLGSALSRAREYSSDKVMKALVPDIQTCSRALIKLAAGRRLGKEANIDEFTKQIYDEGGFFAWLSELLSTHPYLPKRILVLQEDKK